MRSVSRSRRTRTLEGLVLLVLLGGSLRTIPVLDRVLLVIFAPARMALDLTNPGLLAEGALDSKDELQRDQEEQLALDLAKALRLAAQPQTLHLPPGVRAVEAEVLGRPKGRPDSLQVLLADPRGLERGAAVVLGDVFLGKLIRIPSAGARGRAAHLGEVQLLTKRDARVSGRVDSAAGQRTPRMVVGGIHTGADGDRWTHAIHNPQDEGRTRGLVVLDDPDPLLAVANGWFLGLVSLEPDPLRGGMRVAGLEPLVDHEAGLAHVLVLTTTTEPAEARLAPDPGTWLSLSRGAWVRTKRNSGFPVLAGSVSGLRGGAAVVDGVRIVGRVLRVGPFSAMVRHVTDPGCALNAIAVLDGDHSGEQMVLGRIVSHGTDTEGMTLFGWAADRPLGGDRPRDAKLWTLAGEAGMPGGLLLGRTVLPAGPGPHTLKIEPPPGDAMPLTLQVFVDWEASP